MYTGVGIRKLLAFNLNKPLGQCKTQFLLSLKGAIEACAQKNSNQAKEFIYKQYYGYLMAVVLRYIKDAHDAEELVNESFIRVFKNMGRFKMDGEIITLEKLFLGWISRITANLSIDHLRAKKQITLIEDNSQFESFLLPKKPTDNLEVEDILGLLERLPEIQRLIFNLYEVDGYSHEEIGIKLGIPQSTSRTYLTRAKKKLRELYLIMNSN